MGLDFCIETCELLVSEPIQNGEIDIVRSAAGVFVGDGDPEELLKLVGLDHRDGVPRVSRAGLRALVATDTFIEPDLDGRHIVMDATVVPFRGDLLGRQV
jgi:hypothetical protein